MKKTIIEMFKKCQGGKAAVAGFLGLSEQGLDNRLYQTKGQRFTEAELLAVQHEYGLTDYIDELCRQAGGVFVPLPQLSELDEVELSALQLRELAERGILFSKLNEFLADGVITSVEANILRKLVHRHQSATQQAVECTIALHQK